MENILLDPLPQEYEGYLIRTDFRIGIQLSLCGSDPELDDWEKVATMVDLLFGRGMPDFETAMNGVRWFLSCGKEKDTDEGGSDEPFFSFDYDDVYLYSAFRKVYGLDLTTEKIHWFKFIPMMQDIEGTALSNIIGYRTTDTSKMKGEERAAYQKIKKKFQLPVIHTAEEEQKASKFFAQLNQTSENMP